MPRGRVRGQEALFPTQNVLYCGDNLDVLRLYQREESVDLIYLDPPFKKHANYNMLFKELSGRKAAAQVKAFASTWTWDTEAIATFDAITDKPGRVSDAMQAFRKFLGDSEMLAYLTMMAPRLVELHRVLKPTGSVYLHCDPAASHYLKMLMDAVFGPTRFRNEVVWSYKRYTAAAKRFQRLHDVLLFYGKNADIKFNILREEYGAKSGKADSHYKQDESGRWFRWQKRRGAEPFKIYLSEGRRIGDVWEIPIINASARERLGYPTQKPEALLEQIIFASSNPGDVVLDPFCGCGTTIAVAERLGRKWIGIDITHTAVDVIAERFARDGINTDYTVKYEPVSVEDAQRLADERDKSGFEEWAVRRVGGTHSGKRGADKGIDGTINFHDEPGTDPQQIIIQVKAGGIGPRHVRELGTVVRQQRAAIGALVTMKKPTLAMRREAAMADAYVSVYWGSKHSGLQLLTIEDIIEKDKVIDYPRGDRFPAFLRLETEIEMAKQQALTEPKML